MIYTPMRYPGGKAKLFPLISSIIQENFQAPLNYVEPYAGGAGLALALLFQLNISQIFINDLNRSIYGFWYSILNNTNDFIEKIIKTDVTIDEWHKQKEIQKEKETTDLLTLGFSTFFLNRTNRSGILNGGVIGGLDQRRAWKVDARFNKPALISRIRMIAEKRASIQIFNMDACDFLDHLESKDMKDVLYYLDPPYVKEGTRLYQSKYEEQDHRFVEKKVSELRSKWIVSYDCNDLIEEIYSGYPHITYSLDYSAQRRKKGQEFMAFSHNIKIPAHLILQ